MVNSVDISHTTTADGDFWLFFPVDRAPLKVPLGCKHAPIRQGRRQAPCGTARRQGRVRRFRAEWGPCATASPSSSIAERESEWPEMGEAVALDAGKAQQSSAPKPAIRPETDSVGG